MSLQARVLGECLGVVLMTAACRSTAPAPKEPRLGYSIVICETRIDIDAPVVLWSDPGGYDAYSTTWFFTDRAPGSDAPPDGELRYRPGRVARDADRTVLIAPGSTDLEALGRCVDQFVLHYDVCGASQQCFRILQDHRGLSVHFLLDVDGTLYQTLDLRDEAWHATKANPRSIGIEIAHIGGRSLRQRAEMEAWYATDDEGPRVQFPAWLGDGGVRTEGFVARPARPEPIEGRIQGERWVMYDFTPEQYETLVKLSTALCTIFPKLRPDAPRGGDGLVLDHVLDDADFVAFGGILGHYHVQANKFDPGVAFQWEPFLARVRRALAP